MYIIPRYHDYSVQSVRVPVKPRESLIKEHHFATALGILLGSDFNVKNYNKVLLFHSCERLERPSRAASSCVAGGFWSLDAAL